MRLTNDDAHGTDRDGWAAVADCLPWDCGTPSLQTGRSIRDQMIAAGRRVKVAQQIKVEQDIPRLVRCLGSASLIRRSAPTGSRLIPDKIVDTAESQDTLRGTWKSTLS
jgi:hypothetical protein